MNSQGEPDTSGRQRALVRVVLMALGAALLYGGWAVAVNWSHGLDATVRAGAAQVAYSVTTTALMSSLMEAVFARLPPGKLRVWKTAGIASGVGMVALTTVHLIARTPELLLTVLPSIIMGTLFALLYCLNLGRVEDQTR